MANDNLPVSKVETIVIEPQLLLYFICILTSLSTTQSIEMDEVGARVGIGDVSLESREGCLEVH